MMARRTIASEMGILIPGNKGGEEFPAASKPIEVGDDALQVAARLTATLTADERVILVTCCDERDGAAEVAAQVGIALARVSQSRVALVDGDRIQPALHKLFDAAQQPGFGDLLAKETEASLVAVPAAQGIELIPAGKTAGPFTLPDCLRVIAELRERFRYIVISAAPLLTSADSVTLASASDGVLLSIRPAIHLKDEIRDLQQEIIRLRRRLLGAVLREGK